MWKEITIDKKPFFIKTNSKNKEWRTVLVNLEEIWIQNLSHREAVEKCQLLNPLLDVDNFNLDEIINEMLENILNYVVVVSVNEIKLQKEIEGGVFKFTIDLAKGNLQDIWNEIIQPLCKNANKLQRQNEIMIKEIKKKDEEITEYKLNGKLLRKEIETKPFEENIFNDTKINFETSSIFSMFNSLINQSNDSIMNISLLATNSNDNQIKEKEPVEEKTSHHEIETSSVDIKYEMDDTKNKRKVVTSETEIVEMTDEVSKNTTEKVNFSFSKTKNLDKKPKDFTNNKRPRKELSYFIS